MLNSNINILVVDDNQENLKVVSQHLKDEEYKIALALNGKSALQILEKYKIDLILLDVMMPEMDGFELCKIIKQDDKLCEIPVIFLTAKNQTEDIVDGFEAGGVDYIVKPFNKRELLIRVRNHVELAESRKRIIDMNKNRDRMYSLIAHDLRGPFANIRMTIDAIADGAISPGDDVFDLIFSQLSETVNSTAHLLDDLLQWTRNQGAEIIPKLEKIQISEPVNKIVNVFAGNLQSKKITLVTDVPENSVVVADRNMFSTIIRNLLSNAIKFTPENGTISIKVKEENSKVEIQVSDTGKGMTQEQIQDLLNPDISFSTRGTNNESGVGLGFKLVLDFIKKQQAKINIDSNLNKGTSITITFDT